MKLLSRLNLNKIFLSKYDLNYPVIKRDLGEDYSTYLKIKEWFKGKQIRSERIVFYQPGSGSDLLTLLALYDAIVSPKNRKVRIIFLDFRDFFDGVVHQARKYTKGARIGYKNGD